MDGVDVPKKRRISIRKLIFIVVVCGLVYWLVLAAPINRLIRLNQLVEAKAEWQASGIQHYRIVFDMIIPLQLVSTRFSMTVKNGQIGEVLWKVLVDLRNPNNDINNAPLTVAPADSVQKFRLSKRTIEAMLQNAASYIDDSNVAYLWYDVEFDPRHHYVSLVHEHCYGGLSDCGFYYRVIEFEPLTD